VAPATHSAKKDIGEPVNGLIRVQCDSFRLNLSGLEGNSLCIDGFLVRGLILGGEGNLKGEKLQQPLPKTRKGA